MNMYQALDKQLDQIKKESKVKKMDFKSLTTKELLEGVSLFCEGLGEELTKRFEETEASLAWQKTMVEEVLKLNVDLEGEVEELKEEDKPLKKAGWDPYDASHSNHVPDSCKGCDQYPSNGGNGICHCTLGNNTSY